MRHQSIKKIAVFFSGKGSNLKAILSSDIRPHICVAMTDNPDAPGIQHCHEHNLPLIMVDRTRYTSKALFEEDIIKKLKPYYLDYIALAGFMRVLSAEFITHYHNKIINIHPSLLPSYTGLNTHQRVIDNNNTVHGITVHLVTADLDGGPIIAQGVLTVWERDTQSSLERRIHQLEHQVYPVVLRWFIDGKIIIDEHNKVRHIDRPHRTFFEDGKEI